MLVNSEKLIVDPHPDMDQHQSLITSRGSPLPVPAMFGRHLLMHLSSYAANRMTDRQTAVIT